MKNMIRSFALIAGCVLALAAQAPPAHAQAPFANATLVRDVDNPARTPFVARFNCPGALVDCTTQTIIPDGHRMVIETVGISINHTPEVRPFVLVTPTLESSPISNNFFPITPTFVNVLASNYASSAGTQSVRLYSDVLPRVRILPEASDGTVNVSGYFIKK
jgi:hypothetical protein